MGHTHIQRQRERQRERDIQVPEENIYKFLFNFGVRKRLSNCNSNARNNKLLLVTLPINDSKFYNTPQITINKVKRQLTNLKAYITSIIYYR